MIEPAGCFVQFGPTGEMLEARIVPLSRDTVEAKITRAWWSDDALRNDLDFEPIDRFWDWTEMEIEYHGRKLDSELVGVETRDGYIQGAMLFSREPVVSVLDPALEVMFIELLFTAPRNRSILRTDGRKYIGAVGLELLRWATRFSRDRGLQGRLKLDGSPDYVTWYEKLGFQILPVESVMYEGVEYLPMELAAGDAGRLLNTEGP